MHVDAVSRNLKIQEKQLFLDSGNHYSIIFAIIFAALICSAVILGSTLSQHNLHYGLWKVSKGTLSNYGIIQHIHTISIM